MSVPRLILASGSPRRRMLLGELGARFEVRPVDLDESPLDGETAEDTVRRLSEEKARFRAEPGELVLAADTLVVLDGRALGKPTDPTDAERMLALLAGRRHTVLTGVTLFDPADGRAATTVEVTQVDIAALDAAEIAWYVGTGEPLDKAGAYAIQGLGALFVESIDGNYTNVVGLPLPATRRLFQVLGYELPVAPDPAL